MGYHPTNVHGVYESGGNDFTNIPGTYAPRVAGLPGVAEAANAQTPDQAQQQLTRSLSGFKSGSSYPHQQGGLSPSVAPVKAPTPTAPPQIKAPQPPAPDPLAGAAIQTQYLPAAQRLGGVIGQAIGDHWGAGPGVPTAPYAPTLSPSKWAGTHAVEDAYNSPLGQFTTSGIGDYWTGRGLPSARKVPGLFDPSDWWISRQLGDFGRGLAGG
ncbi:hypothetical protein [Acidithiobacillus sulfuriphilus]|uniref:hypothetical protein n=1 Tax=Acidithiobacillus sulfuriphilus TaxID=1867749 RepID=UPI003F5DF6E6